jgi:CBS-domain-containing membrane protein
MTARAGRALGFVRRAMTGEGEPMIAAGAELRRRAVIGLVAAAGATLAATVMVGFALATATPLWLVPFATSIVLVTTSPDSPQAQPRNIVGGHILSCFAGYLVLWLLGPSPFAGALAVGLSVLLMTLTRTLHPPAGVDGLLVVTGQLPLGYIVSPVATGALALVGFAYLYRRATGAARWPAAWW